MISTTAQLIYSAAAARRIFALARNVAVTVQEWASVVWVWVKGQRPRFVSKRVFKAHFAAWRKSQSKGLIVTPHLLWDSKGFGVRNPEKNTLYHVDLNRITCTCEDYKNQKAIIGAGCCKHIYAALSYLGHQSLASYLGW